jgi:acyl-CoA synthetase (AMP-forming)/AMP-acid ligase II
VRPIEVVDRGAAANPHRPALICGEQVLTYAEVRELSCRIAQRIHAQGHFAGTHGAVLAPNDVTGFVCALGLLRAGLAWIPVNARDSVSQIGAVLDRLDADLLFVHSAFTAGLDEIRSAAPGLKEVVVYDVELDRWLGDGPASDVDVEDRPDAVSAIFTTSGTTAMPRGVVHTNRSFEVFIGALPAIAPHPDGPPTYLAVAPLTHVSGRIALSIMAMGGTTVILERPRPTAILEALAAHAITFTMLPPTIIHDLIQQPGVEDVQLPALKYIMYGSAPTRLNLLRRAMEVFGPVMLHGYGQTEAPMLLTTMSPEEHYVDGRPAPDGRLRSVGHATPFSTLAVLDANELPVAPGTVGEVCARGDFIMAGYYDDPAATADVRRGGWHHTGDLGYVDEAGYVFLVDRKKDMIITGGFNVYSAELEAVIAEHPCVGAVAVVGLPHERWGESVVGVIVRRPGASLTAADVIELCKRRLGAVKAPKRVEFWDELPRSPTGKVLKRAIRERLTPARDAEELISWRG